MTYENAIAQLNSIVQKLSSQTVPLSEATKLFEEGMKLIKFCYQEIKVTKGKVFEIKEELNSLNMEECDL